MNTNQFSDNQANNYDDEIDLRELIYFLWRKKLFISSVTAAFSILSIIYSLILPNIYTSQSLLMPVEGHDKMSGMLGQYAGMASLAGISLPTESGTQSQEAIERIKSFNFFSNHFLPFIKLEDLVASKEWDSLSNDIIYDENIFNSENNQWVRKVSPPLRNIPSTQEAYSFYKKIMRISEDKKTGFVSLSVEHISPYTAQKWAEIIIDQIDLRMRDEDRLEATKAIEYLNSLAPSINFEEVRKALSKLQEEQMKQLMLVEASENYVFKVIESPIVPELKSKPKRALIVIISSLLGMMLGIIGSLAIQYLRKN